VEILNARRKKNQKCDKTFLQYVFTCNGNDGVEKPLCLICNETLAAVNMKPSKLKTNFSTNHADYSNKPLEYLERLLKSSTKHKHFTEKHFTVN